MSQTDAAADEASIPVRARQPLTAEQLRALLIPIESGSGKDRKKTDYLPMQGRILWFHGEVSRYTIDTELLTLDFDREFSRDKFVWNSEKGRSEKTTVTEAGVAVVKAIVIILDESGAIQIRTPGTKMETRVDFPDFLEKAETGAIARALALAGYGTRFAIELREGTERLVDAPVETPAASATSASSNETSQPSQTHLNKRVLDLRDEIQPLVARRYAPKPVPSDWWNKVLMGAIGAIPRSWAQEHIGKLEAYKAKLAASVASTSESTATEEGRKTA